MTASNKMILKICAGALILVFAVFALGKATASGSPDRKWKVTPMKLLPREKQELGYQFRGVIPLPEGLHQHLYDYHSAIVGPRTVSEEADKMQQISQLMGQTIDRVNFDDLRSIAIDYCAKYNDLVSPDACTRVTFSPFSMICELMVIVTQDCSARREMAEYDTTLKAILSGELSFADEKNIPAPSRKR